MKILIALIGVVVGSILGATLSYAQERLRVVAATRGALRLLSADLDEAHVLLRELTAEQPTNDDEEEAPREDEVAEALNEMFRLWLTYRDRLATGLAGTDWRNLVFVVRHLHGLPGLESASIERLSTVDDATRQVTELLAVLERRWTQRTLTSISTRVRAATSRPAPEVKPDKPVTLSDLVYAHTLWRAERQRGREAEAADAYKAKRAAFEATEGEIVSAFWAPNSASAVLLTRKRIVGWRALLEGSLRTRFHRTSDWQIGVDPLLADLLYRCDFAAIVAEETTIEPERGTAMAALLQIASRVLDVSETAGGRDAQVRASFSAATRRELTEVEAFVETASARAAWRAYRFGLAASVALVGAAAGAAALVANAIPSHSVSIAAASAAAGSVGAAVSVLSRTSVRLGLDARMGAGLLARLGALRPLVGSVIGIAIFVGTNAVFDLPTGALIALTFAGGFSERWFGVVLGATAASI